MLNNPFGDFNNHQLISDVSIRKSTEISDLVMQQQPEDFCNITDTLNNINNNKFNNHHVEELLDDSPLHDDSPKPFEQLAAPVSNDTNNNSNNEDSESPDGPETDVDVADEDLQMNAFGGEKEKIQMEFKETEDVGDHAKIMNFVDQSAAMFETFADKNFPDMSQFNPEMLLQDNNPFGEIKQATDDNMFINQTNELDLPLNVVADSFEQLGFVVDKLTDNFEKLDLQQPTPGEKEDTFEGEFKGADIEETLSFEKPEAGEFSFQIIQKLEISSQ